MPRRVREFELQSTQGGGEADGYLDRVVKYVPADVVAAWTAAVAVIKGTIGIPSIAVLLVCFIVALGLTFWWTLQQTKTENQPPAYKQAAVATVAFLVWVLALGDLNDALKAVTAWNEAYAKLILIAFTLVSGKI
jgi:FtsH-binding integral membrane protein